MKKISKEATKIGCRLLDRLGGREYLKLLSGDYMPLIIERLEGDISTPFGKGTAYSFAHYYQQNGDLMSDPQMVFIVIDHRKNNDQFDAIGIYPVSYRQDGLGIWEESVSFENGKVDSYISRMQVAHCRFAAQWFSNIRQQGFLKKHH